MFKNFDILQFQNNHSIKKLEIGVYTYDVDSNCNIAPHMVPNKVSHIVSSFFPVRVKQNKMFIYIVLNIFCNLPASLETRTDPNEEDDSQSINSST